MASLKKDCEMVKSGSEKKSGHTYKQWLVSILVATTLLNYGLQTGWISPMKKVLQSADTPSGTPLSDTEMSWVASTMSLSAMCGVFLYTYIADTYGRKVGVIAMVIPQAVSWIVKLISAHTTVLIIGRILAGIPAGGCFNLVPMYVKEISEDHNRGILVALAMTFQNVGSFAMYAMGSYLDYYTVIYIVVCIPITAAILLIIIAPESPAFLVKVGNIEGAARTVAILRGLDINDHAVQKEIEHMKIEEENNKATKNISLLSIFKNKARLRAFLLCTFIMTALDLNGTFTINSYAWTIMSESGVDSPELQTLSVPATMIFGSLVSIICVEKFGRKPILVGGFALSAVALTCLGTALLLQQRGGLALPGWVPVLAIIVSMWSYAAGVLPMTYVILAEIFQFHVRAKLIGGIVMYGWLVSAIQLFSYQPITDAFGMYTTFFVYASVNLVGGVVCLIFVPETMGKSVDEIESVLLKKRVQL